MKTASAVTNDHACGSGVCGLARASRTVRVVSWVAQLAAAGILAQTLFFKFTAAPESVYIFKTMGMEPWGRIGSGVAELIAAVLLVSGRFASIGAVIALGVISGAILSHLTRLGIVVQNDGGLLFSLAILVFVCSGVVAWIRRGQLPVVGPMLARI